MVSPRVSAAVAVETQLVVTPSPGLVWSVWETPRESNVKGVFQDTMVTPQLAVSRALALVVPTVGATMAPPVLKIQSPGRSPATALKDTQDHSAASVPLDTRGTPCTMDVNAYHVIAMVTRTPRMRQHVTMKQEAVSTVYTTQQVQNVKGVKMATMEMLKSRTVNLAIATRKPPSLRRVRKTSHAAATLILGSAVVCREW